MAIRLWYDKELGAAGFAADTKTFAIFAPVFWGELALPRAVAFERYALWHRNTNDIQILNQREMELAYSDFCTEPKFECANCGGTYWEVSDSGYCPECIQKPEWCQVCGAVMTPHGDLCRKCGGEVMDALDVK